METLGRQLLIELTECPAELLDDTEFVENTMVEAAKVAGAEIIKVIFHEFDPHGVSGVVVISESHLAIHTWPEFGYAAVDIFTCGECVDPYKASDVVAEAFQAKQCTTMEIKRGYTDSREDE